MEQKERIDEMLDGIYAAETHNKINGGELLFDELSEEERGRILEMALYKMKNEAAEKAGDKSYDSDVQNGEIQTYRRGKKRRIVIAALAAVMAFATTAFAAEVFQWDARISNYFGIDENNSAELAESGMSVGVSAEQNGVKVEAVQTIGDANNIYILFDLTAPEGTVIYPQSRFDMIYLKVDGVTAMGYGCDLLPDESETDNKATMLLSMEANHSINDKNIEVTFEDLAHYKQETGEFIPDCEGKWELAWKLDYKDNAVKFPVDQELAVNGETVHLDSVSVSPIALNVKASGDYIREYDSVPPAPGAEDLLRIEAVTLADGTVLTKEDSLGWGTSTDDDEYVINMKMKELLEPEKIESITINDTVISLEK